MNKNGYSGSLDFSLTGLKDEALLTKYQHLQNRIQEFEQVLIGFSGGVDSTLLTSVARHILGKKKVVAYLAVGPSLAERELRDARELAILMDVQLQEYTATEFNNPAYLANGPDRCFHCKTDLFSHLVLFAKEFLKPTLLYGGNADDTKDFRPGQKAAILYGALAPLAEAGLTKVDVRALSKSFGLPTADKPAQPCLSSRIPYGQHVDAKKLSMVEKGEALLEAMGFRESRLRHFGSIAQIEVPLDQFHLWGNLALTQALKRHLTELGFNQIEIDPKGFRTGSLNEALSDKEKQTNAN
jgi:pyridinium-3,5-biscarboxylic acid mononucleotide sulfurtransferase